MTAVARAGGGRHRRRPRAPRRLRPRWLAHRRAHHGLRRPGVEAGSAPEARRRHHPPRLAGPAGDRPRSPARSRRARLHVPQRRRRPPHARIEGLASPLVALAVTHAGILDAQTDRPIEAAFLLLAPEEEWPTHLQLLSRAGRLLQTRDVRRRLATAATAPKPWPSSTTTSRPTVNPRPAPGRPPARHRAPPAAIPKKPKN